MRRTTPKLIRFSEQEIVELSSYARSVGHDRNLARAIREAALAQARGGHDVIHYRFERRGGSPPIVFRSNADPPPPVTLAIANRGGRLIVEETSTHQQFNLHADEQQFVHFAQVRQIQLLRADGEGLPEGEIRVVNPVTDPSTDTAKRDWLRLLLGQMTSARPGQSICGRLASPVHYGEGPLRPLTTRTAENRFGVKWGGVVEEFIGIHEVADDYVEIAVPQGGRPLRVPYAQLDMPWQNSINEIGLRIKGVVRHPGEADRWVRIEPDPGAVGGR